MESLGGEVCVPIIFLMAVMSALTGAIAALWRSRERYLKKQEARYDRLLDHVEQRLGVE